MLKKKRETPARIFVRIREKKSRETPERIFKWIAWVNVTESSGKIPGGNHQKNEGTVELFCERTPENVLKIISKVFS